MKYKIDPRIPADVASRPEVARFVDATARGAATYCAVPLNDGKVMAMVTSGSAVRHHGGFVQALGMSPAQAREYAAQLLAAADEAEVRASGGMGGTSVLS
jgi:hypothetical protein